MNCRYCYGSYGTRKRDKDYSAKEFVNMIDELKEMGTGLLTLHGGESLLRKDIGEIINYAKHKGFYVSLNTNGYLLHKRIEDLKCLDNLCFSIDGREENNDKNRGKGAYQKVIEGLAIAKAYSIPCVLSATLTKDTINDMEFLAQLAQEKDCRLQYSILYNADDLAETCSDLVLNDVDVRSITQKILDLKKQGYPIYYSENVLKTTINWPVNHDEKKTFYAKEKEVTAQYDLIACYHGRLKYQIDADGRVVTCWAQDDPKAPNVRELGVKGAIQACHDRNQCRYCAFLANNEHNALLGLGVKNIWNIARIHIMDSFKIKRQGLKESRSSDKEEHGDVFESGE